MFGKMLRTIAIGLGAMLASVPAGAVVTLYGIEESSRDLVRIDPTTGVRTRIGATGVAAGTAGDLAYDSHHGIAYWTPGHDNNNLYTVDLATGAATLVGEHGLRDVVGLAYDAVGDTLFAVATVRGRVNALNVATAAPTLLGGAWFSAAGLDWNAVDGLVGIAEGGGQLYRLSTMDGGGALWASGDGGLTGGDIAYDPVAGVYYASDAGGALFRYTADFTSRTLLAEGDALAGLIAVDRPVVVAALPVQGVPEPGTWIMLLLGFGAIGLGLRRHHDLAGRGACDTQPPRDAASNP